MPEMVPGSNVPLTREVPGLTGVVLGTSWDAGPEHELEDNLVMAAILCDATGKALSDRHFVYFNQMVDPDLSTGRLEEVLGPDKEQIEVDLRTVPSEVHRITLVLYINDRPGRRRTLGQLKSCRLRVLNLATGQQIVSSVELTKSITAETAMVMGELYRHQGGWKFRVVAQGYSKGLLGVAQQYGVQL
ncbi:TerD family protein [Kocuria arenosa]|uniref:TerD family protein n=1 Tax=Kocuria arenosa TaxID=3071446 RepID=UPI0034D69A3A